MSGGRSALGFEKARPVPCLVLKANLGVQCDGRTGRGQSRFESRSRLEPTRLAVKIDIRDIGRGSVSRNSRTMRVPERTVIRRVFADNRPVPPVSGIRAGAPRATADSYRT